MDLLLHKMTYCHKEILTVNDDPDAGSARSTTAMALPPEGNLSAALTPSLDGFVDDLMGESDMFLICDEAYILRIIK
jgi:hypothetical protein